MFMQRTQVDTKNVVVSDFVAVRKRVEPAHRCPDYRLDLSRTDAMGGVQ
jgi:hypothetical protein